MTSEILTTEKKDSANGAGETSAMTFTPRVDILETEAEILLFGDLPGVSSDDLDIRYENKELTICGKAQPRQHGAKPLYGEYQVGDFYRSFQIGEAIDPERISAELKNGVLTVHLPKTEAVKPRRIEVKTG